MTMRWSAAVDLTWLCVFCWTLLRAWTYALTNSSSQSISSAESRLFAYLTKRAEEFGNLARPVLNSSTRLQVRYGVSLNQILDFNAQEQSLVTHVWENYAWRNEILQWNPSDYDGITRAHIPVKYVWTPNIVLYNSVEDKKQDAKDECIVLFHDGMMQWIPDTIYRSSCSVDMRHFPFDAQVCFMVLGPWVYDASKLSLRFHDDIPDIMKERYTENSEYVLETTKGNISEHEFACCLEKYELVTYELTLKRRPLFYVYVLLIPCTVLQVLMLAMFWIPADRPDRTGIGMSLFTSFFVLLLVVVTSSPPSSKSMSLLGVYFCINMILLAMATAVSVISMNIIRCEKPLPHILRTVVIGGLGKLVCVSTCYTVTNPGADYSPPPDQPQKIPDRTQTARHWKLVAYILDRFFFLLFLTVIAISIVTVFPTPYWS